MKRLRSFCIISLLVVVYLCFVLGIDSMAYPGRTRSDLIYARTYGDKTYQALTNCFALAGSSSPRSVVIDGGFWAVTTNLDVSSNITLIVATDSGFTISTNVLMSVDGVNIDAPNEFIFQGNGNATGPIANAYAKSTWQGTESFYLGPLLGTAYVSIVDLAGVSNGITLNLTNYTTNSIADSSNGLALYTREQVTSTSDLLMAFVTNHAVGGYSSTVSSISYKDYPFYGVTLAIAATNGYLWPFNLDAPSNMGGGWCHMSNWNIISDTLNEWEGNGVGGNHRLRPLHTGVYSVSISSTMGNLNTSVFPLVELGLFKNPEPAANWRYTNNELSIGANVGNAIYLGQASGPGKITTRLSPSGSASFRVLNGDTGDTWSVWWRMLDTGGIGGTAQVSFATMSIQYLGTTNLAQ